ncbi:MAG TPA: hypothetical protein P5565_10595, partial [Bacteroidia bacterium]|nr:hypothetical protein [Bacteroidia bacterium]
MRLKHFSLLVFFLLASGSVGTCFGQNQNSIWCFGDSSGINFGNGAAQNFTSVVDSRGSCASISDSQGDLLFYCGTGTGFGRRTGRVYSRNNLLMANGDSIVGEGWYNEMLILSVPDDISSFYLFSLGGSSSFSGVYYSLVDTRLNSGLGDITQKNVLISSFHTWDAMTAVRHANGRDWWLVTRELIDTIVSG